MLGRRCSDWDGDHILESVRYCGNHLKYAFSRALGPINKNFVVRRRVWDSLSSYVYSELQTENKRKNLGSRQNSSDMRRHSCSPRSCFTYQLTLYTEFISDWFWDALWTGSVRHKWQNICKPQFRSSGVASPESGRRHCLANRPLFLKASRAFIPERNFIKRTDNRIVILAVDNGVLGTPAWCMPLGMLRCETSKARQLAFAERRVVTRRLALFGTKSKREFA